LRCYHNATDEEESHTPAEAKALAKEKVPDVGRKGSTNERHGLEEDADEEGSTCTKDPGSRRSDWGDKECLTDGEATDEGIVKRSGTRKDIVCEIVGEKYSVRGIETPGVSALG
jgi:hypothetical protein